MSAMTRRDALGALGALGLGAGAGALGAPAPRRPAALTGEHAGALPFYASKQLLAFRARAATTYAIDYFGDLHGYGPKDKYSRIDNILIVIRGDIRCKWPKFKRAFTPRWMVCHPAMAGWLKAHVRRFSASPLPPPKAGVAYLGLHGPQDRLYHDPDYPKNEVLVGMGTGDLPRENLGWLKINNFRDERA